MQAWEVWAGQPGYGDLLQQHLLHLLHQAGMFLLPWRRTDGWKNTAFYSRCPKDGERCSWWGAAPVWGFAAGTRPFQLSPRIHVSHRPRSPLLRDLDHGPQNFSFFLHPSSMDYEHFQATAIFSKHLHSIQPSEMGVYLRFLGVAATGTTCSPSPRCVSPLLTARIASSPTASSSSNYTQLFI